MLKFIDNFINRITTYRLALYYLIFLLVASLCLSFFKILPYNPIGLLISVLIITAISWIVNAGFSRVFEAPAKVESVYITALILALIITPPQSSDYFSFLSFAGWAAVWATASKYIIAIRKKHIFNPAAFAVALTAITINQSASWWIGTMSMSPFILAGGLLIVRKTRRFDLVLSFFMAALITILGYNFLKGNSLATSASRILFESPLLFFAFIMLTEPLTAPSTKISRSWYGALVGFLFAPFIHIGSIYSTPELSLLVGNVFSYLVKATKNSLTSK